MNEVHRVILDAKCYFVYYFQWFGEGEKYVKAVFSLASKISPSVIFIDEVWRILIAFVAILIYLTIYIAY